MCLEATSTSQGYTWLDGETISENEDCTRNSESDLSVDETTIADINVDSTYSKTAQENEKFDEKIEKSYLQNLFFKFFLTL